MSTRSQITASLCWLFLLSGCGTTPGGGGHNSDVAPVDSLRVAQVFYVATRAEILRPSEEAAYKAFRAAGVLDSDLIDGSIVMARIYCCGGRSKETSEEYAKARVLYVPTPMGLAAGNFVEYKVGRPPEKDDGGRLNTVTRVVAKQGDNPERCWWDPKDDRLWLRVAYCDWMPSEGWVKQGGLSPGWFKPAR